MAVTIGAFSSNKLRAQPFGYEGDARNGLTATTLEFSGLVKPSEWLAFKGIYDAWRNLRIQDQDTLVSKTVGTTVNVTASANGISWTSKPCWFTEAPSASQFGTMVEVSATLVDAAEALQVFLKEESETDCARITADLEKQKAETDCEITALQSGLADDFADQEVELELIRGNAAFDARAPFADDLAELDYKNEVQEKTAQKNKLPTYAEPIAGLDVDLDLINRSAQFNAREPKKGDLAEADYKDEVQSKQGQVSKIASYATTIAGLDEDLDLAQSDADLAAFTPAKRAQIAGNEYDREVLQNTAEITALSTRLSTLKASRQLKALYDKELSEDLPNFGTQSLGSATIQLIEPPEGRIETPSFALTATGNALITGALKPVKTREINGVVTAGGSAAVLAWYDATVATAPAPGALFPAGAPTFEIESVLVNGVKGSRTNVQISVIEIPS
jgi:hypothetical protein